MTRAARRQSEKSALELIEEAVHLLRRSPAGTLATYYAGSLPFVLAWLYFWTDMSRSPFASEHLAGGALGTAALFIWMKVCHCIFAQRLQAVVKGEPTLHMSRSLLRRLCISQTALQTSGLFLMPLALVLVLPFGWSYAFYQSLTALDDGETTQVRNLIKQAAQQATLSPKQNHLLLAILFGFAFFVFLNWSILGLVLPGLVKSLIGVESVFSRSAFSLLNTTFFAVMFGLTYLSVDPILKSCYVLRCFYGQSRQSGADLMAELKLENRRLARDALGAVLALALLQASAGAAEPSPSGVSGKGISAAELDRAIDKVLQQQKYTWRMPREKLEDTSSKEGLVDRFVKRVRQWLRSVREWIVEWLQKLFKRRSTSASGSSSGYGWIFTLQVLLYALSAAVIAALVILLYRIWKGRRLPPVVVASEAIQPAPDLTDENVGVEQLPEDGWIKLGRELFERGELRLALRAFYLASLAHLAARNLISPAKHKSNRDYERELRRRGHSLPEVLSMFGDNVQIFDRIWYGLHEANHELVQQFLRRVEQIRAQAQAQ